MKRGIGQGAFITDAAFLLIFAGSLCRKTQKNTIASASQLLSLSGHSVVQHWILRGHVRLDMKDEDRA